MTRSTTDFPPTPSSAGLLARLLIIIFAMELVEMVLFGSMFDRAGRVSGGLADAFVLVALSAPFIWLMVIRPLAGGDAGEARRLGFAPAGLLVKVLTSIFMVEFLVMVSLPVILPRADAVTRYFADAFITTFLCGPLLWWILSQEQRRRIDALADLLGTPVKLFVMLLGLVFMVDLLEMPFVGLIAPDEYQLFHKLIDAFSTTVIFAPFLWWLVVRPLQRAALSAKARADAVQSQVVEAIVVVDEQGLIESFNPAAEVIFGHTAAAIIGKPVAILFRENDQSLEELVQAATASDYGSAAHLTHEIIGRRRDDSNLDLDVSVSRVRIEGRQQYLAIMRDVSGRKEMERVIRESEERFRSLSESSPVGIFHIDPGGHCYYTNQRWQEITGLTAAESLGTGWTQVDHPEDQHAVCAEWRRSVEQGYDFHSEFRLLTPRGEVRWVLAHTAALHSPDGHVTGYVGTYEDISERKQAEQTLQKSLSLLTATLDSTADGILVVENTRHLQTFNQKFLDMWLVHRDHTGDCNSCQLLDQVKEQLVDPETFIARVEELYSQPEATAMDILRFRDGRIMERYTQPQVLEGMCIGRVWSFRDITAKVEAERALRESEERFRQIFEQTEDAIFLFRPAACEMIDVNPTAEKLYGYSRTELLSGGVALLARPADLARLNSTISGIGHGGVSNIDNIVSLRKDGSEIIISMRGKLIPLQGEDVVYCTFRDITGRVRLEEESRDIQAKLIQANKMTSLGLLVSGVAHEINNPNNFIMANSQMLAKVWEDANKVLREYHRENGDFLIGGIPFSELAERSPQLFAGITEGARRIEDIVGNLKNFARQDQLLVERDVDLNRVVTTAVSLLLHQLNRYTDNFHLDLAEDLPFVTGSYQQLEQVAINLLLNAGQALPDKNHGIWVTTGFDAAAGLVTLAVRDEGRGMERDVSNRVMEPFFTTKLDSGGTGLGLSISLSIVKEHNGSLEFESEPDKGTTFIVKIPAGTSHE
jgi:PAS domain S-box-containing protein